MTTIKHRKTDLIGSGKYTRLIVASIPPIKLAERKKMSFLWLSDERKGADNKKSVPHPTPAKPQAPTSQVKGKPIIPAREGSMNSKDTVARTYDPAFVDKASDNSQDKKRVHVNAPINAAVKKTEVAACAESPPNKEPESTKAVNVKARYSA